MSDATLAYVLILASGTFHAIVNAIFKSGRDLIASRAIIDAASALMLAPLLFVVPLPGEAWPWLAMTLVIHLAYLSCLVRAFAAADFSAAYPVLRGIAPLIAALIAIGIVGEPASLQQIGGIALIGGGMLAMVAGRHIDGRTLRWAAATGFCIALYTIADAHGVRAAPSPLSFIVWFFCLHGVLIALVFGYAARAQLGNSLRSQWRPGLIAGFLSIATYGLALYAFSMGPTAPIAALRETGMITALLIAIFVFGERVTAGRIAGIAGLLGGAVLILTA